MCRSSDTDIDLIGGAFFSCHKMHCYFNLQCSYIRKALNNSIHSADSFGPECETSPLSEIVSKKIYLPVRLKVFVFIYFYLFSSVLTKGRSRGLYEDTH